VLVFGSVDRVITTVVAGNPKPLSRTLAAGVRLAELITGSAPDNVIDVIGLGPGLLGWGDPAVAEAVATVKASDLVIFASPTYKGSYTGVLKLFLDQFEGGTGLAASVAVPLMLGGGPAHAMAPDLVLKPVLVEIGATVPCQGLFLLDGNADAPESSAKWRERWTPVLLRAASSSAHPTTSG
jgi:FMN reductase